MGELKLSRERCMKKIEKLTREELKHIIFLTGEKAIEDVIFLPYTCGCKICQKITKKEDEG